MEKALLKMARQLRSLDEASLMSMWDKYAEIVRDFEPSERWEEAVLVLSFIQSVRMKNQLFNHHWANVVRARDSARREPFRPDRPNRPDRLDRPDRARLSAQSSGLDDSCCSQETCGSGGPCGPREPYAPSGAGKPNRSDVRPALGNGQGKRGKLIRFQAWDKR